MFYVIINVGAKVVVADYDGSILTYHDKRVAEYAAMVLMVDNPGTKFTTSSMNQSYWKGFHRRKLANACCSMRLEKM